jgi:hypothetical protein
MKLNTDEKELLDSVERGEWKSTGGASPEITDLRCPLSPTFLSTDLRTRRCGRALS